eukprot:scaffold2652_cov26-Tisochrysis_lutea.AAC.2
MICQGTAFDIFFSPWHAHIGAPPPGYPPAPYGAPPPHGEQPNDGVDVCSSAQLSTILLAFIWCACKEPEMEEALQQWQLWGHLELLGTRPSFIPNAFTFPFPLSDLAS